jgi:hypothetical protein
MGLEGTRNLRCVPCRAQPVEREIRIETNSSELLSSKWDPLAHLVAQPRQWRELARISTGCRGKQHGYMLPLLRSSNLI